MVAKKKQEKEEKSEETQTDPTAERRAAEGDVRVPSDLEHFQPADIPPEPLTPHESSSTAPPEE